MTKKFLVVLGAVVGICCVSGATYTVYAANSSVKVNGVDYKVSSLSDDFQKNLASQSPVFVDDELNQFVTYNYNIDSIVNRDLVSKVKDKITGTDYDVDYTYSVDYNSLHDWIKIHNSTAKKSKDAKIVAGKKKYKIQNEVQGTKIDYNTLIESLDNSEYNIDLSNYYKEPEIVSDDLKTKLDKVNSYVDWEYKYKTGEVIKTDIDHVKLLKNGEIVVDDSMIDSDVRDALSSYNTVGKARKFKKHNGKKITVSGGTWGSQIDFDTEVANVKKAFNNGKSKSKMTPAYLYQHEKIGDTYIEVSIADQHVWYYKNDKLIMDTSCVTGTRGSHDTPTGIYYIMERINGKYLTGDNYKTWVNKWMRLTYTGIGLHDATWRGSFGGSIYTYSGSHGCINLPYSFASELYDSVYVDMPVIIY